MGPDRRVERRMPGELLIYPARHRLLVWGVLGLVFTLGGVWMLGWAEPTSFIRSEGMIRVTGAFVTLFFGAGTIFLLTRASSRRPLVVINDEGIACRESVYRLPFIRWEEIAGVSIEDGARPPAASVRSSRSRRRDPTVSISRQPVVPHADVAVWSVDSQCVRGSRRNSLGRTSEGRRPSPQLRSNEVNVRLVRRD